MVENEIPRAEMEAAFKLWKKNGAAAFMKIYDDGAVKVIDGFGVITFFETPEEFLDYARRFDE